LVQRRRNTELPGNGGFGSYSYRLDDGKRSIHVKLATDQTDMRRWLALRTKLEEHYSAPNVLAWVNLPGTRYGGLVFEHIDGRTWDPTSLPALLRDRTYPIGIAVSPRRLFAESNTWAWPWRFHRAANTLLEVRAHRVVRPKTFRPSVPVVAESGLGLESIGNFAGGRLPPDDR
jgi:hypothetical protein